MKGLRHGVVRFRAKPHTGLPHSASTLRNRYQSSAPGECSPGDGTPLVVYKNLVSDIEAVFTVEELEKKTTITNVGQVRACMQSFKNIRADRKREMPWVWHARIRFSLAIVETRLGAPSTLLLKMVAKNCKGVLSRVSL